MGETREVKDLDQILTDARGEANVLRRAGFRDHASFLDSLVDEIAGATEEYRRWLNVTEAGLQSGMSQQWLRANWHKWAEQGHARRGIHGEMLFRQCVLPRRANITAAREDGRRAGEKAS